MDKGMQYRIYTRLWDTLSIYDRFVLSDDSRDP